MTTIETNQDCLISNLPKLLDVIIPTYKRPGGAVVAALSVLDQIDQFNLIDEVNLIIWDDCTPSLDLKEISLRLEQHAGLFEIGQNMVNKGMSSNICDLVESSKSDFCTILTDDDWFEPDSLPEVLDEIRAIKAEPSLGSNKMFGAFFTPRYSYLDDGSLHCIECTPFPHDNVISGSSVSVIKNCRNAFILTGLFFKPSLVDFLFWRSNQDNAFFPLLYYASIASACDTHFLHRKWLHHTCLNLCHWEAWGSNELHRYTRLHLDYLKALILVAHKYPASGITDRVRHANNLRHEFINQLSSYNGPMLKQFIIVYALSRQSFVLSCSYLQFLSFRARQALKLSLVRLLRHALSC